MIYEKDNVYYLKSGNGYEIANIEIKYNRIKNKNVLHVVGNIGDESINYYIYFHEDGYQYILGN